MRRLLRHLRSDDRGATAIEYALLAGIVSISILLSAQFLADDMRELWGTIGSSIAIG